MPDSHKHPRQIYFDGIGSNWDSIVGNDSVRIAKLEKIIKGLGLAPGMKVLDTGCGNGVLVPLISDCVSPGGMVTAIDESETMVAAARLKYPSIKEAEYISGSIEKYPLNKKFYNAAVAFAVLPHIDDRIAALTNIREALASDGVLYIFHLSDTKSLNKFHASLDAPVNKDMMPERDELQTLLETAGYKMVKYIDEPGLNFVEARPCVF